MNKEKILKLRKMSEKIKILYVEDDMEISHQLEKLFKKVFKNIDVTDDGEKGLEKYTQDKYDIVITDIEMPNMNGIDMIKKIREINYEQIVIVTSAYNDTKYLQELIELGVDMFILKPFDMNRIFTSIAKIVASIYRKNKEKELQVELDNKLLLNQMLLDKMITPILILNSKKIKYKNEKFIEMFETNDLSKYSISKIFNNEKISSLNYNEFFNYINENNGCEYSIKLSNNEVERFKVNVTSLENSDEIMVCFFNIEAISLEIQRLQANDKIDKLTSLYTREAFSKDYHKIMNLDNEYVAICFGLKHIKKFIKIFGLNTIKDAYKNLSNDLKIHLKDEILENNVTLYYFDTNRFVALVKKERKDIVKGLLESFGSKYYHMHNSIRLHEPMYLDILESSMDKSLTLDQNLSDMESKLYMLID